MNSTNIFTNSYNYIVNYLVNDKIIIKDNDSTATKIKQYLLKYKRIIGIILLIILIYIGYESGIFISNNNTNSNSNVSHSIQKGGLISTESVSKDISKGYGKLKDSLVGSKETSVKSRVLTATTTKLGAKNALHKGFKETHALGARLGEEFKERSSALYSLIYSVAFFIIICIIFIPSIAFIVGGIMCYVLLKGKMRTIKGL